MNITGKELPYCHNSKKQKATRLHGLAAFYFLQSTNHTESPCFLTIFFHNAQILGRFVRLCRQYSTERIPLSIVGYPATLRSILRSCIRYGTPIKRKRPRFQHHKTRPFQKISCCLFIQNSDIVSAGVIRSTFQQLTCLFQILLRIEIAKHLLLCGGNQYRIPF